jgi:serine/threonine-protein kinase HipA
MRPKATVMDADGSLWLAKFSSTTDRFNIPIVEAATLALAHQAQLRVCETRTQQFADLAAALLIRRFDRLPTEVQAENSRIHFISALTLLGVDEREYASKSYTDIAAAIRQFGVSGHIADDIEELFGRMVFNILVHNNDDHLRNHGFLWDHHRRGWRLSPLYDVLPNPSLAHERYLLLGIGANGRLATLTNAISWHEKFGLSRAKAIAIVDRIWKVVREWKQTFEAVGVSGADIDKVGSAFRHARDIGGDALGIVG